MITWNRTRKRNQWGSQQQAARPAGDWLAIPAPTLRDRGRGRLAGGTCAGWRRARRLPEGHKWAGVRPAGARGSLEIPADELHLVRLLRRAVRVRSRSHGTGRERFYGCEGNHERGRTVCANGADVPMTDADDIVIEMLLDDMLDETMIMDAVDAASRYSDGPPRGHRGADRHGGRRAVAARLRHCGGRIIGRAPDGAVGARDDTDEAGGGTAGDAHRAACGGLRREPGPW